MHNLVPALIVGAACFFGMLILEAAISAVTGREPQYSAAIGSGLIGILFFLALMYTTGQL